jgi:glycosyltransferase involved in cell wall biosynthesis
MNRKRFLLITYYWPPSGGGGVIRWLKMSRYIREYGWEPVIYTPHDGETPAYDESLLAEIPADLETWKTPIWEPYTIYKRFLGRKKEDKVYSGFINEGKKVSLAQKISVFIRGNFFIPDARMFWIRPSIRFLCEKLRNNPVEVIVSTGPPHSLHLIAKAVSQRTGIPWIADFRDPWTKIDFYKDLHLTALADARHKYLEKQVLTRADKVVAATWSTAAEFRHISAREDLEVVTNGFDHADFADPNVIALDTDFSIAHIGSMNKDRSPDALWAGLAEALEARPAMAEKLRLNFIGPTDFSVRESLQRFNLDRFAHFVPFVPHAEAVQWQQRNRILLMVVNDAPDAAMRIPGKLYEYLAAGRPILAIGEPDSDSAKVLRMSGAGKMLHFSDRAGVKSFLLDAYERFLLNEDRLQAQGIQQFTRQHTAGEFARILDQVAK